MKKQAKDVKKGDVLKIAGEIVAVESIEVSDLGKQGTKKCRIVAKKPNGDSTVIIRPTDYPLEVQ